MSRASRLTRRQLLLGAAALLGAAGGALAGCAPAGPPAFADAVMAYDAARQETMLFGSRDESGSDTGVWTWNGRRWTLQHSSHTPATAPGQAVAYDAAMERVVVFGGWFNATTGGHSGQLWGTFLWNGQNWTDGPDSTAQDGAGWAAMTYDAAREEIVRFGGQTDFGDGVYTWTLGGNKWTLRRPATNPPLRTQAAMAYDAAREQVVLFGGADEFAYLGDTWVWDGSNWSRQEPELSPHARGGAGMVYDAVRQQIVLFGGAADGVLGDMWTWDGRNWSRLGLKGGPPARVPAGMVYDEARNQLVLFGGRVRSGESPSDFLRDTWTWDGTSWTKR